MYSPRLASVRYQDDQAWGKDNDLSQPEEEDQVAILSKDET
jgi:hypothetical protein